MQLLEPIKIKQLGNLSELKKLKMMKLIRDTVCDYFGSDGSEFDSTSREGSVIKVRHYAVFLCLQNLKTGPTELKKEFKKNHATIIHIGKKVTNWCATDKSVRTEVEQIQNLVIQNASNKRLI